MSNTYTFDQIATILNQITADAQGRTASISTTPRSTADFVTMARVAMSMGTDPIMHALQQRIGESIQAVRAYNRTFKLLDMGDLRFGNVVEKVTPIFTDSAQEQLMYDNQPADGQSVDQYKIKRPKVLRTIYTGATQYEVQAPTVFVDQLNSAFQGPAQLGDFLAAQLTAVNNDIEQHAETLARMTCANFIGAKIQSDSSNVIHLLTEYNAETGLSLTATTVFQPDNFVGFVRWMYARINEVSDHLRNRSEKWHKKLTGYTILRHTDKADQRLLLYSKLMRQVQTMVSSNTYHDDLLSLDNWESVDFWQNENAPFAINVTCNYLDSDGTVNSATVAKDKVVGILFDKDAMGYNTILNSVDMTPRNAKNRSYNTFYHMSERWLNDTTENAVVFLLD